MDHLLPPEARVSRARVVDAALGASVREGGVFFRVWAPRAAAVGVELERDGRPLTARALDRTPDGRFEGFVAGAAPGDEYRYRVDGAGPFPDPASRFQPRGVHGPSLVVDPERFRWTDADWKGVPPGELVFYELHVGAFTPAGTFDAAAAKLGELAALGVTAIELMPVGDFPGSRNWGYDGSAIFAPSRAYGDPDGLRRLVDAAHARGLAVFLDVVYNHLGPDGNYTGCFSPFYFTSRHRSPWGDGVNLDGEECRHVRAFFVENAVRWIREYRLDGLRLDATHALVDDSRRHFLSELRERIDEETPSGRRAALIAEDDRNLDSLIKPPPGGFGLDAVWADDFHHQVRRLLAGDRDGYYRDFADRVEDLTTILRQGWLYTGQHSVHHGRPRGTPPEGLAPERFVFCLQNHDQIGNRAHGERLDACIDDAAFRAATVLLLTAPQTPLLFMGQEWGASTPFLYFTDHEAELGRKVTEGRRREFSAFDRFADPAERERIPDPQAPETFARSRLRWEERAGEREQGLLRLHRDLLRLRRAEFSRTAGSCCVTTFPSRDGVALRRPGATRPFLILVQLRGAGRVDLSALALPRAAARWRVRLSTEDAGYTRDARPILARLEGPRAAVEFSRSGAVVLEQA